MKLSRPYFGLVCLLPAAFGLLLLSGCKSGFGGDDGFSWKNPFTSSKSEDSEREVAKKEPAKKKEVAKKDDTASPAFAEDTSRARNLEKAGKYEEARTVYQRLIVKYPERYEPYHRLAVVADRQKRFLEAQGLYAEAIRLNPKNPDLFNDLGYCQFLQGRLDKAEASLLKAVSLAPSNPKYRNNLGMVYGHQGRYDEALAQFRRAGSESDAYYNLAFVKAAKDDVEGAKECFNLALAADPTFEPARRALASFRKADENPVAAMESGPSMENGTYWVPYNEDGEDKSKTQTASLNTPSTDETSSPDSRTAKATTATKPMRTTSQSQLRRAREDATSRLQQGYSE
jgi:Flp pilus assembly protein TadD